MSDDVEVAHAQWCELVPAHTAADCPHGAESPTGLAPGDRVKLLNAASRFNGWVGTVYAVGADGYLIVSFDREPDPMVVFPSEAQPLD